MDSDCKDLVPIERAIVMPAPADKIEAAIREFERAKVAVLRPEDIQHITGKDFVKKSGWRRLARAFNLSMSILKLDIIRDSEGCVTSADCWARATAPNGVYAEAFGGCDVHEPRGFNKGQDIVATAQTRAVNRAISDLVAGGEVSAEEMVGDEQAEKRAAKPKPKTKPHGAPISGWDGTKVIEAGKNSGKQWCDLTDRQINFYVSDEFGEGWIKDDARLEYARRQALTGATTEERISPEKQLVSVIMAAAKKRNLDTERIGELIEMSGCEGKGWKDLVNNSIENLKRLRDNVESEPINLDVDDEEGDA